MCRIFLFRPEEGRPAHPWFRRGARQDRGARYSRARTSAATLDARPVCLPRLKSSTFFSSGSLRRTTNQPSKSQRDAKLVESLEKVQVTKLAVRIDAGGA